MTTPIIGAPELVSGQAIPETTVNEIVRYLEFLAAGGPIEDRDIVDSASATETDGYAYLIDGTGANDWSGQDGDIALYFNTDWIFITPSEGMVLYVKDEDVRIVYDGSAWAEAGASSGGASTTQTTEMIAGYIGTVAEQDYRIVVKMAHGGAITETTTRSGGGTCTFTFKVNTTALGGTANSVSTSEQSQAHASTNTFVAGDDIVITASSNSSCLGASFTIKYTRTLES